MIAHRNDCEAKRAECADLPVTRRTPRVAVAMPPRWSEVDTRTYRHAGPLSVTIRLTSDGRVTPFCVVPDEDGFAFFLDDARRVASDITALLGWLKGRTVEARRHKDICHE